MVHSVAATPRRGDPDDEPPFTSSNPSPLIEASPLRISTPVSPGTQQEKRTRSALMSLQIDQFGAQTVTKPTRSRRPFWSIIADGVHVHPMAVNFAYQAHTDGCVLITDGETNHSRRKAWLIMLRESFCSGIADGPSLARRTLSLALTGTHDREEGQLNHTQRDGYLGWRSRLSRRMCAQFVDFLLDSPFPSYPSCDSDTCQGLGSKGGVEERRTPGRLGRRFVRVG